MDYIQVESFIPGCEFALEGLVTDGRLQMLALFDKPEPLDGPFFQETIYVSPSRQPLGAKEAIYNTAQRAVTALGLQQGQMRPTTAASLIGAGMLSVFIFPLLALGLLRRDAAPAPVALHGARNS